MTKRIPFLAVLTVLGVAPASPAVTSDSPNLVRATFFGGLQAEEITGAVTDDAGNVFVTGIASGGDLPTTIGSAQPGYGGGSSDAFVAGFDSVGDLLFATFLGGAGSEHSARIARSASSGALVITGHTFSADFPVTADALRSTGGGTGDVFLAVLSADGSAFTYSTLVGGVGYDRNSRLALAPGSALAVVGLTTSSDDLPVTPGALQPLPAAGTEIAVAAIDLAQTPPALVWLTYFGGSDTDEIGGVTVLASGEAIVAGTTNSPDLPSTNETWQPAHAGGRDAFVARIGTDGGLVWGTFLGGAEAEEARAVAIDATGRVLVAGNSASPAFPTSEDAWDRKPYTAMLGFVSVLSDDGVELPYSTRIALLPDDIADRDGRIVLFGAVGSLPLTSNYFGVGGTAYIVELMSDSILFSSMFSSYMEPRAVLSRSGSVLAVGRSGSPLMPATPGAFRDVPVDAMDAYLLEVVRTEPGVSLVAVPPVRVTHSRTSAVYTVAFSGRPKLLPLTKSSGVIDVPATVEMPPVDSYEEFTITGAAVGTADLSVSVPPELGGGSATISVEVLPVSLSGSAPAAAISGGALPLTLLLEYALATDVEIALTSSDPAVAPVPASVTVPAGVTSHVVPLVGSAAGTATITATLPPTLGASGTSHDVTIASGTLSMSAASDTIESDESTSVTVTIDGELAADTPISLTATPDSLLVAPAVEIPAGEQSVTFAVTGTVEGDVVLSATLPPEIGGATASTTIHVVPPDAPPTPEPTEPPSASQGDDGFGSCACALGGAQGARPGIGLLLAAMLGLVALRRR